MNKKATLINKININGFIKKIIAVFVLCLMSLTIFGCSLIIVKDKQNDEPLTKQVYLYSDKSNFVSSSYGSVNNEPLYSNLNTYRTINTGDVPYVEIEEFANVFDQFNAKIEKVGNVYNYVSTKGVVISSIDPANDILRVYRPDESITLSNSNNGIQPDLLLTGGIIKTSLKSNAKGKYTTKVIDLKQYGLDYIEEDGKCYAPLHLVVKSLFIGQTMEICYNGVDFYLSASANNPSAGAFQSFYANVDRFLVNEKHEAIKMEPAIDEAYRFYYVDGDLYKFISLKNDGTGAILEDSSLEGLGELSFNEDIYITFSWSEDSEGIYVDPSIHSTDDSKQITNNINDVFKIPKKATYYGTKTRSKETIDFNYKYLGFVFDHVYGLQKEVIQMPFDEFVKAKGVYEGLMSPDAFVYDEALLTLTMTYIDDCHTKYLRRSIYSGFIDEDIPTLREDYYGPRRDHMKDLYEEYTELRTSVMSAIDEKYEDKDNQIGVFMMGNTAVIRFDEFIHDALTVIHNELPLDLTATEAMKTSTPKGFDISMREIKNNPNIENIVIDLTCNGGGAVVTMPYLVAHFTNDPKISCYSNLMEVGLEFHYEVDLNRDGKFDENDTYQNDYNWYILTSDFSFSCGNLLPTIAKEAGIKIIGKQSAGGTCPVYMYTDASGSIFNSSTNMQMGTFEGILSTFVNNDQGVEVDYELSEEYWYDLEALNEFINNLE